MAPVTEFEMTEAHLKLLRRMNVSWQDVEFGAPEIDPKRPYGNSNVIGDMAEILGVEPLDTDDEELHWPPGTSNRMVALHRQMETALQVVLATGEFRTGRYQCSPYCTDWSRMT
jgi:hypothetical protein